MDNSHPEKECDYSFDVMNNLPEFIKETILEYLPIKEAVRTCILSKDWRHTWSKVHNLYIDVGNRGSNNSGKIMAPGSEEDLKSNEEDLKSNEEDLKNSKFIDKVLNLHNGNVDTLKISGAKFNEENFERLMLKLSQMQIRKLILDLECKRRWPFPSTCHITGNCAIKLPNDFNGLKLLRSLHLSGRCKINETDITKLISSCPLLEELMLKNFSYCVLKIHAMNLRKMKIVGNFGDLYLQTPKLLEIFIFLYYRMTIATLKMVVGRNLLQALSSISHLRYLSMICCEYSDTLVGSLQAKNPPIFSNLFCMDLCLRPTDAELTLTLLLFQNAPKLQKLVLLFQEPLYSPLSSVYERLESRQQGLFSCLRSVIIGVDPSSDFSIAFTKFILKNAPVLEELIICSDIEDQKITSWSCELKKLSVTTKIIFKVQPNL